MRARDKLTSDDSSSTPRWIQRDLSSTSIHAGYQAWMIIACVFGAQLYFSLNANINDPEVNPLVPITKDALWVAFFGALSFAHFRQIRLTHPVVALAIFYLLVLCLIFSYMLTTVDKFGLGYIVFFKNQVLYGVCGLLFAYIIFNTLPLRHILQGVLLSVAVAQLVGLGLHYLSPIQSWDGRLYGTFGNPTSVGFAAILGLTVLYASVPNRGHMWRYGMLPLFTAVISLSGSLSAMLGQFAIWPLALAIYMAAKRNLRLDRWIWVTAQMFVAHVVTFLVVLGLFQWSGIYNLGLERLLAILAKGVSSIAQSDSLVIRLQVFWTLLLSSQDAVVVFEYMYRRSDSFFLNLINNFGYFGLFLPLSLTFVTAYVFLRSSANLERNGLATILLSFCIITQILNPLVHHQAEIFPTNFLFFFVWGVAICYFDAKTPIYSQSTAMLSPIGRDGPPTQGRRPGHSQ